MRSYSRNALLPFILVAAAKRSSAFLTRTPLAPKATILSPLRSSSFQPKARNALVLSQNNEVREVETTVIPKIIQGGMGVRISSWQLAREVSKRGCLGVVSGTAMDVIFVRTLQDGEILMFGDATIEHMIS
jgi:hypothetical protein